MVFSCLHPAVEKPRPWRRGYPYLEPNRHVQNLCEVNGVAAGAGHVPVHDGTRRDDPRIIEAGGKRHRRERSSDTDFERLLARERLPGSQMSRPSWCTPKHGHPVSRAKKSTSIQGSGLKHRRSTRACQPPDPELAPPPRRQHVFPSRSLHGAQRLIPRQHAAHDAGLCR